MEFVRGNARFYQSFEVRYGNLREVLGADVYCVVFLEGVLIEHAQKVLGQAVAGDAGFLTWVGGRGQT